MGCERFGKGAELKKPRLSESANDAFDVVKKAVASVMCGMYRRADCKLAMYEVSVYRMNEKLIRCDFHLTDK
jgi:hypothetical protein